MKLYSAKEAADELGTDGKTLRRFLRQDASFQNAGSGGRYTFSTADLPKLKSAFTEWNAPRKNARTRNTNPDGSPGLPFSVTRSRAPQDRARVKAESEARVDRLEAALRASGLHISQMRDRDTFRTLNPA